MTRTVVTRDIKAPPALVFEVIGKIENYAKAVPHIVRTEILSERREGVGTRFSETRLMQGKEVTTELEVTEYVEGSHIRIVADSHGTIWDTSFDLTPLGDGTDLVLTMDARAYEWLPTLMNPLIKPMVRKAVEGDMDMVKAYCERQGD